MESTKTSYQCDACGEEIELLQNMSFHRQFCMKSCSPATLVRLAHDAIGKAANAINDLQHANIYRQSDIQDMTNMLSDIAKMVG